MIDFFKKMTKSLNSEVYVLACILEYSPKSFFHLSVSVSVGTPLQTEWMLFSIFYVCTIEFFMMSCFSD